ncbi:Aspartate aminotransferase [Cyanobacterium sp. HL-69]|uniref:LL-diaminopimelate aminotransferase n=1 Tax=Cyanobacterium sp. HL-69 TaxID=2054282 RepID=UPI000CA1EA0B|nr:Aspartate aminotransferase [Cyanobacterium sp. HL-69]
MELAKRIKPLKSNVFADMDRAKTEAIKNEKKLIDLSLGSADLPTPKHILKAIASSLNNGANHGYLLHRGTLEFRQVIAQWYEQRFGVKVDPDMEVLPLIGSQEGTAHLPLTVLNEGDYALVLDPGYPSHAGGVYLAGGHIYPMPLLAENDFLPQFEEIPADVLSRSKMMILSYPHNPTSAIAPKSFFEKAVNFCKQNNLVLVHDFPYLDIYFEDKIPPSILECDPEKQVSIEFFTFSKSYNMGGFRIGFAIGNSELITALRQVKSVVDFNQYKGILEGAMVALTSSQECVQETVDIYRQRRDFLVKALHKIGWEVNSPSATLYLWAKLPSPYEKDSIKFCVDLVKQTGVALSPGAGFGKQGESYVRFALVQSLEVLQEAVDRIGVFLHTMDKSKLL